MVAGAPSLPHVEAVGEQIGQSGLADRVRGAVNLVLDAVVGRVPLLGVELEPGRARVAVAGLADAARVEQSAPLAEVELVTLRGLAAAGVAAVSIEEVEGDVGVPDHADAPGLLLHALDRLVDGEHVLPDRVAG